MLRSFNDCIKRTFDLILSSIGIILLLPIFLVVIILLLFLDPGPILFKQHRIGKDGTAFRLIKFRTMRVQKETEKGVFLPGDSSRVTKVGRLLRKTKLDELPQLWNVLIGDMSIVGPRPEVKRWIDAYPERWAKILILKPGITDYASIKYRDEEKILAGSLNPEETYLKDILPKKMVLYEKYLKENNLWVDIKIICKTLVSLITENPL